MNYTRKENKKVVQKYMQQSPDKILCDADFCIECPTKALDDLQELKLIQIKMSEFAKPW